MSANAEGRFWFFFLVALCAYISGTLSAEAGTISFVGTATLNVPDSSCAASMAAARAYLGGSWYPFNCSADPLVPGSYLMWFNASTRGLDYWAVSSISAPAPSVTLTSLNAAILAMQANGQDMSVLSSAILSIQSTLSALQGTVSGLQTAVAALQSGTNTGGSSGSSQPFDYVAAGILFSFFFSFTVGVWVVSKNMGLILNAIRRW